MTEAKPGFSWLQRLKRWLRVFLKQAETLSDTVILVGRIGASGICTERRVVPFILGTGLPEGTLIGSFCDFQKILVL